MEYPIRLLSEDGHPISSGRILAFYPNGTYAETHSGNTGSKESEGNFILLLSSNVVRRVHKTSPAIGVYPGVREELIPKKFSEMTIFCAADHHKAKILRAPTPENTKEITLKKLEHGGSAILADGQGGFPGFHGWLNPQLDSQGRTYIHARNTSINGGQSKPVRFKLGEPLILEDNRGTLINLIIKAIIDESVILEYERMPPGSLRPAPSPSSAFADPPESVVADDWEPLPIDRAPPQHEEVIQEAVKALEDVIEGLRGNNGYAANKPEECAEVLETLESGKTKIQTANAILKGTVRRLFNSLSKARETFHKATIEGGKIAVAMDALTRMAKTLWEWLPF